jgi:type III secretion system YscQ/HrcQ family protein
LEAGDILLSNAVAAGNATDALPVTLRVLGGAFSAAALIGTRLVMEGPMMQETPIEADEVELEEALEESPPVMAEPGSLSLAVAFDLGGLTLSVAEMAALAPGKILETGRDVASPVRITVAGKTIGTGSLFDVAGRIGVRIETLHMR